MSRKRKILGAPLGHDVHVAGTLRFLRLAEEQGYDTEFLGPAVGLLGIIQAAQEYRPDILAVSYRLTPDLVPSLAQELHHALLEAGLDDVDLIFGGTPPAAEAAAKTGIFRRCFSGLEGLDEIIAFLQGRDQQPLAQRYPDQLLPRLAAKR
ncbi:MAG TPA: cobalamin B12-binding domain-containing protein, partial [Firmicutes bacterium]|nr:cobalamin B12-binding domain-containing protein [Bacillota bacterium]